MKKIVLAPIKNEAWILDDFLKNLHWADLVLLADQYSVDATRDIAAKYPNARIINNDHIGHSNKVRWQLLDAAREALNDETNTDALIFCLDADEMISLPALQWTIAHAEASLASSDAIPQRYAYPWIQLYGTARAYRNDGVWRNNTRGIAFTESTRFPTQTSYDKTEVINDHTDRIPHTMHTDASGFAQSADNACPEPVLHLHFLATQRSYAKQAWYMCQEVIKSTRNPKEINYQYRQSIRPATTRTATLPTPDAWLAGLSMPAPETLSAPDTLRIADIKKLFAEHGIERFEALDIWNSRELREEFTKALGRNPQPQTYHPVLVWLFDHSPKTLQMLAKKALRSMR